MWTVTNPNYWDCECKEEFIHPKSQEKCEKCGALREDQPDSISSEVEVLLATRTLKLKHLFDGWLCEGNLVYCLTETGRYRKGTDPKTGKTMGIPEECNMFEIQVTSTNGKLTAEEKAHLVQAVLSIPRMMDALDLVRRKTYQGFPMNIADVEELHETATLALSLLRK